VVGGAGVDPNTPQSPWAGIGVVESGPGHFTGALIGPRHVLTAAHVVAGRPAAEIRFRLNLSDTNAPLIQAKNVRVFPGFKGTNKGPDGFWHKDLAVVELVEPVPAGTPVYPLSRSRQPQKSMIVFVGYGGGGDGIHGATQAGNGHTKRVGYNRIDVLLAEPGNNRQSDLFLFDFDGPDFSSNRFKPDSTFNASLGEAMEATFAGGDSGAPIFVFESGQWRIVGIAAFVTSQDGNNSHFGALAGATLVPAFLDWILDTLGNDVRAP
jgi:hypothetical protein